jgi:hypothetical protein
MRRAGDTNFLCHRTFLSGGLSRPEHTARFDGIAATRQGTGWLENRSSAGEAVRTQSYASGKSHHGKRLGKQAGNQTGAVAACGDPNAEILRLAIAEPPDCQPGRKNAGKRGELPHHLRSSDRLRLAEKGAFPSELCFSSGQRARSVSARSSSKSCRARSIGTMPAKYSKTSSYGAKQSPDCSRRRKSSILLGRSRPRGARGAKAKPRQLTNRRIRTFIATPSARNVNNTEDPP